MFWKGFCECSLKFETFDDGEENIYRSTEGNSVEFKIFVLKADKFN